MRPRALILTLLIAGTFWVVTTRGSWKLKQILQPLTSSSQLWSEPVTARGANTFDADEQNNIDIYKTNRLVTVNITSVVYQRDFFQVYPSEGTGSGVIINDDGQIITNNHVINGSRDVTVTLSDHKQYKAEILGIDRRNDLALIKIRAGRKLPFARLGDSENLQVGQKVLAIGNPFGLEGTLTTGIVSSLGRSLQNEEGTLEGLIQTDAAINPGNSGGPMFDSKGSVIGINTAIYGAQTQNGQAGSIGIGFAVPVSRVKAILEEYRTTGRISHPVLGISQVLYVQGDLAEALNLPASGGLLVTGLEQGSPADDAGIHGPNRIVQAGMVRLRVGGDLITAIDGVEVDSQDALRRAINRKRAGDKIELSIFRGARTVKVSITLGAAAEAL